VRNYDLDWDLGIVQILEILIIMASHFILRVDGNLLITPDNAGGSVMEGFSISGNILDVLHKSIFPGTVTINNGQIQAIVREDSRHYDRYILPGFIDAHVHIESSMLVPTEFARLATVHGTVAAVSDPLSPLQLVNEGREERNFVTTLPHGNEEKYLFYLHREIKTQFFST
jgi:Amidohydrolase family